MGTFVYDPFDKSIIGNVKVVLPSNPPIVGLASEVAEFLDKPFPFQFPPRISSDSKGGEWTETAKVSYEPLAIWQGATARKLTITAQYAVVDSTWSGLYISRVAFAAKSYFYRSLQSVYKDSGGAPGKIDKLKDLASNVGLGSGGKKAMGPIVTIESMYGAIREKSTWRLTEVSVEYNDNFVRDGDLNTKSGWGAYPLTTKITFNCVAFTQIAEDEKDDKALQPYTGLVKIPTSKWY